MDGPCASSLRQALWLVRSGLMTAGVAPEGILDTDQDTIGLRRDARIELDVARFEGLAGRGGDAAEEAIDLYRGDLLEGLGHECFAAERERVSDLYEDALAEVARMRLARGDVTGARSAATGLLERDPLREEAHAVLIAAYGLVGSRSQVVRQYRRVTAILRSELSVPPLPETEATYRAALARTLERSRSATQRGVFDRPALAGVLVSTV
jgi:DNA-binding SARP family transcriptional activator